MAKKKLILNESTTRQFMKYANIKPTYVSNFLNEAEYNRDEEEEEKMEEALNEEEEEEMEMDADMEAEPEMDMDMETEDEMDMEDEGEEEAEDMVMDLLGAIKDWAQSKGVTMELEGDEEDMEDEGMEDMDAAPEGGDMGMADDDVDADLEAAGAEAVDDEEVIAEVTRRVARRLLRESAKRK